MLPRTSTFSPAERTDITSDGGLFQMTALLGQTRTDGGQVKNSSMDRRMGDGQRVVRNRVALFNRLRGTYFALLLNT